MHLLLDHEILLCALHFAPADRGPLTASFAAGAIIFTVIARACFSFLGRVLLTDFALVLSVLSYFGYRARIPFSALLLQVVIDVSKHHKSVYVVAFCSLLLQTALSVLFTFTAVATCVARPARVACRIDPAYQVHEMDAWQPVYVRTPPAAASADARGKRVRPTAGARPARAGPSPA